MDSNAVWAQKRAICVLTAEELCVGWTDNTAWYSWTNFCFQQNMGRPLARSDHILTSIAKANMTLNFRKCEFARSQLVDLGYLIDEQGHRPNPRIRVPKE